MEQTRNRAIYESVDELARELGVSRQVAYRELKLGNIPAIRLGKRFVIPRAAVQTWLANAGLDTNAAGMRITV